MAYPTQKVLELSCAAYRFNDNRYIKIASVYYTDSDYGKYTYLNKKYTYPNKSLMLVTLDEKVLYEKLIPTTKLIVEQADIDLAAEIRKYYRRLMFDVMGFDNSATNRKFGPSEDFFTALYVILEADEASVKDFAFIACLPHVYFRDKSIRCFQRKIKDLDNSYLGPVQSLISDKDCEIIECEKSKNYDAWNVFAIIDNKLVSWMSKKKLNPGPYVIISANIKDQSHHYKYGLSTTRLNYIKGIQ